MTVRKDEFARRRRQLMRMMGKGAIAILPTATEKQRNGDVHYHFRPDSDFHYLTGFDEPEAIAVLVPGRKCDYVTKELGFDACVDYKAGPVDAALKAAAPAGVDVYFDNVGGEILDAVLRRVNTGARIPLWGLISGYDGTEIAIRIVYSLLVNRVRLQGFIVTDRMDLWPGAMKELAGHVATGRIKYRETVAQGLEAAPRAFLGMLRGENFGKQLVRVSDAASQAGKTPVER